MSIHNVFCSSTQANHSFMQRILMEIHIWNCLCPSTLSIPLVDELSQQGAQAPAMYQNGTFSNKVCQCESYQVTQVPGRQSGWLAWSGPAQNHASCHILDPSASWSRIPCISSSGQQWQSWGGKLPSKPLSSHVDNFFRPLCNTV